MSIASFSVERPVAVTMRIAALVLLGAVCLTKLPIDLLPKVSIPTISVNTAWANVAPEEMETTITRPIEEAVSQAPNIYNVSSSSTQGNSSVRVQFNWGTDIGEAAVDVLQLVERAKQSFPTDPTLQSPLVFKFDPSTLPILIYGVTGIKDPVQLRSLMDNDIGPIVEAADGVASATATGGLQRAIIVNVDPVKLRAYGLSLVDIENRIDQENIDLPAGIAKQSNTEYTIRADGYFNNPQEAAKIPVGTHNGAVVPLGDVATVSDSHQEQRISTRINGVDAVGLIIIKQSEANTVTTAQNVRDKIKQVQKLYPQLKFNQAYDQSGFIVNSIDDLKNTAIIGGLLAIIILLLFLRNFRSTMVVALSIPISIISTFALFYFCGFTLNTISLSGLALSTGLIVDDAVVVLENIFRHIERDKKRAAEAAVSGTNEIFSAVVASTLTIMVVFFPLLLIKGQAGQTFTQFAFVVIFSIAVSLLDATTVVPMLASRLIREDEIEEESHPELRAQRGKKTRGFQILFDWSGRKFNELDAAYHRGLKWALARRFWIVGSGIVLTMLSFLLYPLIGSELLPQTDSGNFTVTVKHPVGTSYDTTNATMRQVEKILLANKDVETVFSAAGTSLSLRGTSTAQIGYQGSATVQLKDARTHSTQQDIASVQKQMNQLPGVRILVTPYDLVTQILTGGASNMEVDVFSQDLDKLDVAANQVLEMMRKIPGLDSVDLGVQEKTPELRWKVDRDKALALGVTFQDIANTLETATNGQLSTYYQENGFQYPIYVQLPENQRKTVDELLNLPITPSAGGSSTASIGSVPNPVLLRQVAIPQPVLGPNEVDRLDRQRYIAVTGREVGRADSDIQADIAAQLQTLKLAPGVYTQFGQNQQRKAQEFSGLGVAVFLAISLIYMLLASQFESFIYPLIVLTSVPLCSLGVLLSLFLTGRAIGLTAFIGFLMLIGIVVKNGILLVDYTNQLRTRGMERDEAILTASPTRLRPILMTTAAAILGMMPLALQLGKGSETEAPLATVVVGGLLTSTMLTLFIVPCVYTMFDDLARRFRKDKRDLYQANLVGPSASAAERSRERNLEPELPGIEPTPESPTPTRSAE